MKIAIYGKKFSENFVPSIQFLFSRLKNQDTELYIYEPFSSFLFKYIKPENHYKLFTQEEFSADFDLLLSIGGDGTILDAITMVKTVKVPILGINTGRLGFLSNISREEIARAIEVIRNKEYTLDERHLLTLKTSNNLFGDQNFALNELTVSKRDSSSMITVQAFIDNEYLNSYWADGIIIATPTGSTAYSLSCGGPILVPTAGNFIITPIAPHNLNVRPIVVSDTSKITLRVEGRHENFMIALDSRPVTSEPGITMEIARADFTISLVKLPNDNFYSTLRNKLLWGLDKRN